LDDSLPKVLLRHHPPYQGSAVSGGVWHPDGCRCSGCIPARQVVIRQEYPSPGPPRTPQQHPRKPSPRKQSAGDYGIIGPLLLIVIPVILVGFWPVMVWHGYGGPTGNDWRWDIHSTVAESVYIGLIALFSLLIWAVNRPPKLPRAPRDLRGSIRRVWEAIDEDERGGPRRDLRDVANEEEAAR
jgi:hypothetical protein